MKKRTSLLLLTLLLARISNAQSFTNPILAGFYPDPSICRAGDDYYIVNSSFAYFPGLPLFHSKDLLNWKQIGYAMDRPGQLNLDSAGVSRGLFAPAISYHNGTFYIVCTEVSKLGNFVITAKDPRGPWSDPVKLPQVNGIDPSLFFDNNGKAYIVFNSIPPNNISLHEGHRTIRMFEFDVQNLKVVGEEKLLVNGGTDMSKKPVWIEGPHLIKKDGWYYLICAEGGTGYDHSEVVFRSKSPEGPFVSYDKNPILTQRQLDPNRKDPITTAGHADFVEDKNGNWWGVFLACRPYEGDFYNTGRETFMAPVVWKEGWPEFNLGGDEIKYSYPIDAKQNNKTPRFNGNYTFYDNFPQDTLNKRYRFLRTVHESWYRITDHKMLQLKLRPETMSGNGNPSFIGFHQPHLTGHASTGVEFHGADSNQRAGLVVFQNEKAYYFLCRTTINGQQVVALYKENELLASIPATPPHHFIYLKIQADKDKYSFFYATRKNKWQLLKGDVDAKHLSTKTAGGFVGSVYGMYATSNGQPSSNAALFEFFEVKNNDAVYKK
ncbi:glycoside hydrolase family 43 protein [Terrimonas sp. NA20]|uniref:Glycoside hydrolase family 43 protein n=1 Tax=Terrimonas ginsenosidimutans TaxID=2908004 RepID=A0ABS9KPN7_9BACT|nr:glycoside hydrolase family 43 protein [Terrimonas ginsenosidimutans]MCG2614301.1 glycoside hydrolase family 43 protein [Terrimonas ginsenosidimutans]